MQCSLWYINHDLAVGKVGFFPLFPLKIEFDIKSEWYTADDLDKNHTLFSGINEECVLIFIALSKVVTDNILIFISLHLIPAPKGKGTYCFR